jgi:tellurite resistance protein
MAAAMTGLKGMLEKMTAFTETVNAAAAAQEEQRTADLAAQATEMVTIAALVEAAYLVASADGNFSSAESDKLARQFNEAAGGRFGEDYLKTLVDAADERKKSEGADARMRELGSLLTDGDLRRSAIAVASGIAWLDRGVGEKEGLVLQGLARAFEMPITEMHKILGESKRSVS